MCLIRAPVEETPLDPLAPIKQKYSTNEDFWNRPQLCLRARICDPHVYVFLGTSRKLFHTMELLYSTLCARPQIFIA